MDSSINTKPLSPVGPDRSRIDPAVVPDAVEAMRSPATSRMREVYSRFGIGTESVVHDAYTDTELMEKWFLRQTPVHRATRSSLPLWEAVCNSFAVMEGSARKICARHGFDPDTLVKRI